MEYTFVTDHKSKNQAMCDALATDIGGILESCAVVDVHENNVNKYEVRALVSVAGPKRASSYRKNANQIFARAVIASSATNSNLLSSDAFVDNIVITTTTTVN